MVNSGTLHRLSLLLFALSIRSTLAQSSNDTCFYPNGVQSNGGACYPDQPESVCCGPGFVCLSNGLCQTGPDLKRTYRFKYYRSSCTDGTWNASECPSFCLGGKSLLHQRQETVANKYNHQPTITRTLDRACKAATPDSSAADAALTVARIRT